MSGQLCWLSKNDTIGCKTLHIRIHPSQPWQPYTNFPHLAVTDYNIPQGSKGWATSQKLLQMGWTLVPCSEAQRSSLFSSDRIERAAS